MKTTAPLKCVVVTPFGNLGGQEKWLLDLIDDARPRLDLLVVLLAPGPLIDALSERGVPTEVLSTSAGGASVVSAAWRLSRSLRRSEAEVVLANGVKGAAVAVPAANLAGLPVVWAKHDFSFDRTLARLLGRGASRVMATSEAVARAVGRDDVDIVPPSRPDDPDTSPAQATRRWAARGVDLSAGPVLATVGRLVPYKGVDTAVEGLTRPGAEKWRLVVIGGEDPSAPGERQRLINLAERFGVADRVHLIGEIADAGRELSGFDAVAVLTRRDEAGFGLEGYSLVALEALASGVPIIGAQGNPEVVRMAAEAGVVVPPQDPDAVAAALCTLQAPGLRQSLAAGARSLLAGHPDAATCAGRVVQILAEAAHRPGAGLAGPPISVLTCLKNESGHVDDVVGGVLTQLDVDDEYLVLDDGSTDGTRHEVDRWANQDDRIRVLDGPGINLSAARNHGMAQARHATVACTDAGCAPVDGWLDALRSPFAEPDPVDLIVGVYSVTGGDPWRDALAVSGFPTVDEARRPTPGVRAFHAAFGRNFSAHRLDGRSMAVSVEAWRDVGGFDPSMFSSEDAAFGDALIDSGHRTVLAVDAEVVWEQGDPHEMVATYRSYGRASADAGHWRLVVRDLVRAGAYAMVPVLAVRGGTITRGALAGGAGAYLSLPYMRAVRNGSGPLVLAAIPVTLVGKDIAKVVGCLEGLASRATTSRRSSSST